MMNSFQRWAIDYCASHGLTATTRGNWVEVQTQGTAKECMTYDGVRDAVRAIA